VDPTAAPALRREAERAGLAEADLPAEPLELWRSWLADAESASLAEPNAMVVATVDPDGAPSCRLVLCKSADDDGFVFYTNYTSRKGLALDREPRVSLLFPWHPLARQVRIEGSASRIPAAASRAYFATRPRGAQLSALASAQSRPVADRAALESAVAALATSYAGLAVPCPPHWGGYAVRPSAIEFWQGRADRLHDRLVYRRSAEGWRVERLAP
jgi:pyridoxamine 5'-phosphate oxidase